jgi:hypothetical protein
MPAAPDRYPPTSAPESTPAESTTPTEPAAPPTTTPATPEEPEETDIFDLGESRRVLDEPGGLSSGRARIWHDAAGKHACEAQLAAVSADGVVLARADGKQAEVSFTSLSDADLQFVRRQVHARQLQIAAENAAIAASPGQ